MTRNGIFYDLTVSPYYKTLGDFTYFFSSRMHLQKFCTGYKAHRLEMNDRLKKRYGIPVLLDVYADIYYYTLKESRGFLIYNSIEGEYITCKDKLLLSGEKVISVS